MQANVTAPEVERCEFFAGYGVAMPLVLNNCNSLHIFTDHNIRPPL
jgi:hypothetical protein